jgi:hypothetical protein
VAYNVKYGDGTHQYPVPVSNKKAANFQSHHFFDNSVNRIIQPNGEHNRRHDLSNREVGSG